jgi:hypothetical protein
MSASDGYFDDFVTSQQFAPERSLSRADLTTLMAQVGQALAEPIGVDDMVERITHAASDTVIGAEYASITLLTVDGDLQILAETHPIASEINELQRGYRQGPRFDAVKAGQRWVSGDLGADDRWPLLGPALVRIGIRSMMSTAILSEPQRIVLNLFSRRTDAFDPDDVLVELFAHHARVALGYASELATLRQAVETRSTIGAAVGIVMERYDVDESRAFGFLVRQSQNRNVKLRVIAEALVRPEAEPADQQE